MNRGKFFRRTLLTLFTVSIMLFATVVGAKIQMYTATGEDYPSAVESQDMSKKRALDKAIKKATKQAGVYLKTYSRSINSELTDDEVTAITSNAWQLVDEPKFTREIINHSDDTQIIVWKATVEVNVDDSEIQSWIKRDDKDKSTIITQTKEVNKATEENERQIEDLREKYNRATSQAEKDSIRKQMNDADREFLAIQKFKEGLKFHRARNYNGAIKLYNEAIQLNPNYADAYCHRGVAHNALKQREMAFQDINKAIKLNPNYEFAYEKRGLFYMHTLKQYEMAIQDFSKIIELNPNDYSAYADRANAYKELNQYEYAVEDYSKAIELKPNTSWLYSGRASAYRKLKQYKQVIQDYTKEIQLSPNKNHYYTYTLRAHAHYELKQYELAIKDYTKCIELNPNHDFTYYYRGKAYYQLKKYKRAIKDFDKALEINPNQTLAKIAREECYKAIGKS